MIAKKLKKNSNGVATLVIVIIAIVIIVGAGAAAYVVLSNNNGGDEKDGGGDGGAGGGDDRPISTLGGPGLKAGDSLTYTVKGDMKVINGATTVPVTINNALTGTIGISYAQVSGGDYEMTVDFNLKLSMNGTDIPLEYSETTTISELDMMGFGSNATDISGLDLGYTPQEIAKIQALVNKFTSSTETIGSVDGNVKVEKRVYSYSWNDLKDLIPDMDGTDIPFDNLAVGFTLWFGKDVLYKANYEFNMTMTESGDTVSMALSGSMELTKHTK